VLGAFRVQGYFNKVLYTIIVEKSNVIGFVLLNWIGYIGCMDATKDFQSKLDKLMGATYNSAGTGKHHEANMLKQVLGDGAIKIYEDATGNYGKVEVLLPKDRVWYCIRSDWQGLDWSGLRVWRFCLRKVECWILWKFFQRIIRR